MGQCFDLLLKVPKLVLLLPFKYICIFILLRLISMKILGGFLELGNLMLLALYGRL